MRKNLAEAEREDLDLDEHDSAGEANRLEKSRAETEEEFIRLPGLFHRWEIEKVLECGIDYHFEKAGELDGFDLFAIYHREP